MKNIWKYLSRSHTFCIFTLQIGKKSRQKIPLMVASGGGGISNSQDLSSAQLQHGQGFNATMGNASGMEYGPNPGGELFCHFKCVFFNIRLNIYQNILTGMFLLIFALFKS